MSPDGRSPSSLRRVSPALIVLAASIRVGGVAAASLRITPAARPAPPLAVEDAHGVCPDQSAIRNPQSEIRVASQETQPPPAAKAEAPEENPEGKNSPGCVSCHKGTEPSHAS